MNNEATDYQKGQIETMNTILDYIRKQTQKNGIAQLCEGNIIDIEEMITGKCSLCRRKLDNCVCYGHKLSDIIKDKVLGTDIG